MPYPTQDPTVFVPGNTPFGYFDDDPQFQVDAIKMISYVRQKLGAPMMTTHLSSSQIFASFEEACSEYSAIVNQYQAKSTLAQFLGAQTGSLSGSENTFPNRLLEFERRMSEPYSNEAGLNSPQPLLSGTILMLPGVQQYDLQYELSSSGQIVTGSNGQVPRIFVKTLHYTSPLQAYRFFGTTSAINYLNNQFNFESFTPETIFYLLPIWEDILRGMQFKTSNNVRRSNYSYEMHNNVLTIFPVPTMMCNLFFTYQFTPDPTQPAPGDDNSFFGVANLSNIPFGIITYSKVNSISKRWIQRFAYALAEEVEGQIRAKMATIPIPNGELTLNGPQLVEDGRRDQESLRQELKDILDETTYDNLMKREAEISEAMEAVWSRTALKIYIG
ncbi:MAG: hypothetical protein ACYDHY_07715 [Acidiferrobacterales bacterium]